MPGPPRSVSPPRPPLLRAAAALAAAALGLAACATTGGREPTAADDGPPSLTIATSFTIDDLDPLANGFWGPEFGYVELLMRPDRSGDPTPWVLSDLTNVDDTTWALTLHEGVTFGSGRELDGEALAQLLTWTAENNEGFAAASAFASAEATGPLEVRLTTSSPVSSMPAVLADESNVLVLDVDAYQAFVDSGDDASALLDAGLYTGPYQVDSLDARQAQLSPVDGYWDGDPALSALTVSFVPEASSRVQAVQTGEADLALYMPTDVLTTLGERDDSVVVTGEPTGSMFTFVMNTVQPAYSDVRVRRALNAAVDYRELAEDVLQGNADVATGIFPASVPYAVDTQETDVDLADELLDEAGWVAGADGVRTRDGSPLVMRLLCYPQQPDSIRIAEALQVQLGEVGVDVRVSQVDDMTEARQGPDWDAAVAGNSVLSFGGSPVDGLLDALGTGGAENWSGVSDPELDALISRLQATFDTAERDALLEQVQQVVADGGYFAAAVARTPGLVTSPEWQDYEPPVSNLWVTATTAP